VGCATSVVPVTMKVGLRLAVNAVLITRRPRADDPSGGWQSAGCATSVVPVTMKVGLRLAVKNARRVRWFGSR
jgi:hypothetical protein